MQKTVEKTEHYEEKYLFVYKYKKERTVIVDDEYEIVKGITSLFKDAGEAGFGTYNCSKFNLLSNFNVREALINIFNKSHKEK